MFFGVSPQDITKLAKLTNRAYRKWTNHQNHFDTTALDLLTLGDILDHIKTQTLDPILLSNTCAEDFNDWTTLFTYCSDTIEDVLSHLTQPPLMHRLIKGKLNNTRPSISDDLRVRLRSSKASLASFCLAFGLDSITSVDRAFNDLESFRHMRDVLDGRLPRRGSALPESRHPSLSDSDVDSLCDAEVNVVAVLRPEIRDVLVGMGYAEQEMHEHAMALNLYFRRAKLTGWPV